MHASTNYEYATFSSDGHQMAQAEGSQGEADPIGSSILQMDPPRQRQLRNLVSQAFTQVLEERRQHPQNDLVSALLAASVDGQRLSNVELLGFQGFSKVGG